MKKKAIFTLLTLLIPLMASGQWRVGLTAGGAYNHYSIDKQYWYDYQYEGAWSPTIGLTGQYDFNSWFGLRADLSWTQKNHREYRRLLSSVDYKVKNNYLLLGSHAVVTQPIAVLANCKSISMAEVTSLGCQLLDNGKLIGTQTWGGFCGLVGGEEEYSQVYASSIGEKNEAPVWAYIPALCSFPHGKVRESIGLTPDIEVALDEEKWLEGLGPDSQLDRALQYIRSGN